MQKLPTGELAPVWFFSAVLSTAEKGYSTFHREFTAVLKSIKKFHYYLDGVKFTVRTDHQPLVPVLSQQDRGMKSMGTRWAARCLTLTAYDFEVKWVPGNENVVSDAFTRAKIDALRVRVQSIAEAQKYDGEIMNIQEGHQFYRQEGVMYRKGKTQARQVVLPNAIRKAALDDAHDGHVGPKKMLAHLRTWCWWPNMESTVNLYTAGCADCQRKLRAKLPTNEALHLPRGGPWQDLALDACGPFNNGKHILVLVDMFTEFAVAQVVDSPTADAVIEFVEGTLRRFGVASSILSDNGAGMKAKATEEAYVRLGLRVRHSTPYTPTANGIVERLIKTIKEWLRANSEWQQGNSSKLFVRAVDLAVSAYNRTKHSTTHFSPFYAMFHRDYVTALPSQLMPAQEVTLDEWLADATTRRLNLEQEISWNVKKAEAAQDRRLIEKGKVLPARQFRINDLVLVRNPRTAGKMEVRYNGPWRIAAVITPQSFMVERVGGTESYTKSVRDLVPYIKPDTNKNPIEIEGPRNGQQQQAQQRQETPSPTRIPQRAATRTAAQDGEEVDGGIAAELFDLSNGPPAPAAELQVPNQQLPEQQVLAPIERRERVLTDLLEANVGRSTRTVILETQAFLKAHPSNQALEGVRARKRYKDFESVIDFTMPRDLRHELRDLVTRQFVDGESIATREAEVADWIEQHKDQIK